jgi:predicted nuclease of restriction endonuclease-like (RecB) superfamily
LGAHLADFLIEWGDDIEFSGATAAARSADYTWFHVDLIFLYRRRLHHHIVTIIRQVSTLWISSHVVVFNY